MLGAVRELEDRARRERGRRQRPLERDEHAPEHRRADPRPAARSRPALASAVATAAAVPPSGRRPAGVPRAPIASATTSLALARLDQALDDRAGDRPERDAGGLGRAARRAGTPSVCTWSASTSALEQRRRARARLRARTWRRGCCRARPGSSSSSVPPPSGRLICSTCPAVRRGVSRRCGRCAAAAAGRGSAAPSSSAFHSGRQSRVDERARSPSRPDAGEPEGERLPERRPSSRGGARRRCVPVRSSRSSRAAIRSASSAGR